MHGMTHGFFQLTSLCHCRHACNLHGTVGTLKSMFFLAASRFSLTGLRSVQCNYRLQCAVAVNVQCVSSAQKSTGPRALVLLNRHSMPTYTARTCEPVDCFLHLARIVPSHRLTDHSLFWHSSEPCETIWLLSITARIVPSHRLTIRIARNCEPFKCFLWKDRAFSSFDDKDRSRCSGTSRNHSNAFN